ncbi:MAG: glycosyltransferase, partial [Muribaculaceae bacterium]|nr:glycosyltransferase [Muribaculaceae bacterium]
ETMPESSLPAVSVIVACYNSEKTIGAMIESVLSQSYTDLELIITDDGSTDGTPEVIRQYAARDSRIIAMRTDIHTAALLRRETWALTGLWDSI